MSSMRVVLKARPCLFACGGCAEFGQVARDVGAALDRRGLAEMSWLGDTAAGEEPLASKARARFPIFSLDGCGKGCARIWLEQHGVKAQRSYLLTSEDAADPEQAATRIASEW